MNRIFGTFPGSIPDTWEQKKVREAILLLAKEIDKQDQEMKKAYEVAGQILVAIGKLDEKL